MPDPTDAMPSPDMLSSLSGGILQPPAPQADNYVMAPDGGGQPAPMDSVNPAGPVVGMQGSPTMDAISGQKPTIAPPPAPMWQRIVMGALTGAAMGAGQKTFGTGMAAGATGVLQQKQQNVDNQQRQQQIDNQTAGTQSNIKFRDAQSAAMAADQSMKDAQLHALPQEVQDAHNQAAAGVAKEYVSWMGAPTQVFDNTAAGAQAALQQQNANGGVGHGTVVNTGDKIYYWNTDSTAGAGTLQKINQSRAYQNLPPYNQNDFQRLGPQGQRQESDKADAVLLPPVATKDNVVSTLQLAKNQQDTYNANPAATPEGKQFWASRVAYLQNTQKALQDQEVTTESRKNAANVSNQQAVTDYKQNQKDARTYGYAFDPNTQEAFYVNKAQADAKGLANFEPQTPTTIKADLHDQKVLNDVALKSNQVRASLQTVSPTSLGVMSRALEKYSNATTLSDDLKKEMSWGSLSKDAQNYVINVLSLRESAMGMQKVLTGSARANESQIAALQATLPGIESSSDVALRKLDAFNQNLDMLRQGVPKNLPGTTQIQASGNPKPWQPHPQSTAQGTPVYNKAGQVAGYTKDGKTMTPVQ